MRRFFCVTCNKVKRVQQWPFIVSRIDSPLPEDRVGECNYHNDASLRVKFSGGSSKPVVVNRTKSRKAS